MSMLLCADGADAAGSDSLYVMDSALFVVCLDHVSPHTLAEQSRDFLHGTSSVEAGIQSGTCLNRWYDKSLQVRAVPNDVMLTFLWSLSCTLLVLLLCDDPLHP